jgi:hypothetical protein
MMLASTVQFSKYGRSRSPGALRRGGPGPKAEVQPNKAAVPSGPNSVLGSVNHLTSVPSREASSCLTQPPSGRTNWTGQLPEPNNQCSTKKQATSARTSEK